MKEIKSSEKDEKYDCERDAKVENIVIIINKEKEKKCTSHVRCGYNAYLISTKVLVDFQNLSLLIVIVICLWQNIQFQHITFTIHTMGSPITEIRKRVSNNNKQNIYS